MDRIGTRAGVFLYSTRVCGRRPVLHAFSRNGHHDPLFERPSNFDAGCRGGNSLLVAGFGDNFICGRAVAEVAIQRAGAVDCDGAVGCDSGRGRGDELVRSDFRCSLPTFGATRSSGAKPFHAILPLNPTRLRARDKPRHTSSIVQRESLMNLTRISAFSVLLLVSAFVSPVEAVTTFSDAATYVSATGTATVYLDFDGVPEAYNQGQTVTGTVFDPRIAFRSPEAADPSTVVRWFNGISDSPSLAPPGTVGPLEGVFFAPTRSFALVLASSSTIPTIELLGTDGSLLGSVSPAQPFGFFGVHADHDIGRWVIRNGIFPNGSRDRFRLDSFQAVTVPEANAVAQIATMMAIGAFSLVRAR